MQGQNYFEKCIIQINYFKNESLANRTLMSFSDDEMKWIRCEVLTGHLQRTCARETDVMQQLEKHNLTGITNAPAAFLIQF